MSVRFSRLLPRLNLSRIGIASVLSYSAVVIESETGTNWNDVYEATVYPGLNKTYPHSLVRLRYPVPPLTPTVTYLKQRFLSKQFAMGQYASDTTTVYRLCILTDYNGTELTRLIQPTMRAYSQQDDKYHTSVDNTRTGSLFFKAVATLKLNKDDEVIFLCNKETNNVTIWTSIKGQFNMHFTIESELLIDCIDHALGTKDSTIFETTFQA